MPVWAIVLIVLLVLVVFYVIGTYNKLIGMRNKVGDQFSQIDVQLKKRSDLIPNLVETVKGYTKHESETLENVIKARNTYLSAGDTDSKMKASGELSQAISKLFALAESYPDLKANTNFLDLQSQLKDIEDKIGYARQFFNDAVMMYNNKIQMFPSNIVASIFGFKMGSFFEATDKERENVQVKF